LGDAVAIDDNAGGLASVGRGQRLDELSFGRDRAPIDRDDAVVRAEAGIGEGALSGDVRHNEAIDARPRVEPQAKVRAAEARSHRCRVAEVALGTSEIGVGGPCARVKGLAGFLPRIAVQYIGRPRRSFVLLADAADGVSILHRCFPRIAGNGQRLSGDKAAQAGAGECRARSADL
jgi:hypothetical protein